MRKVGSRESGVVSWDERPEILGNPGRLRNMGVRARAMRGIPARMIAGFFLFLAAAVFAAQTGPVRKSVAQQSSKEAAFRPDTKPPRLTYSPVGGTFNRFPAVALHVDESAILYYTVDGREPTVKSNLYRGPITFSQEGRTVLKVLAEDLIGNFAPVDSQVYWVDTRPPNAVFRPGSGRFGRAFFLRGQADEPCRFHYAYGRAADENAPWFSDSLRIDSTATVHVVAVDRAGNRGEAQTLDFVIDSRLPVVTVLPAGGLFNRPVTARLRVDKPARIFFSLDELAPQSGYQPYRDSVVIPAGRFQLSYFAVDSTSNTSLVERVAFLVDNTPPAMKIESVLEGQRERVTIRCNEKAEIVYTLDGRVPAEGSPKYTGPILVRTEGVVVLKAMARDEAGNASPVLEKRFVYDKVPPTVAINRPGGAFNHPVEVILAASEPATVYYTLNGRAVDETGAVFHDKLVLSRNGRTELRYRGQDVAGHWSPEYKEIYVIDATEPAVSARIEGEAFGTDFRIVLTCSKPSARIHYEIDETSPTVNSPTYAGPIVLRRGQSLSYFARDVAGNRSRTYQLDDLKSPAVEVNPPGGAFREAIRVEMKTGRTAKIHYRLFKTADPTPPLREYGGPFSIAEEGVFTLEYYARDAADFQSPIRREKYIVDRTPPSVTFSTSRGGRDSTLMVHFVADENASIYYTLDGSHPGASPTTAVAGNKYFSREDRVEVQRRKGVQIVFYGEDLAGNRGAETRADLTVPRAVPGIPSGLYHSMQTVSLQAPDQTRIYYTLDGGEPGLGSKLYSGPLTLTRSTQIKFFAVDETGFRGPSDSAFIAIDLPPVAQYRTTPGACHEGDSVTFDAGGTVDEESPGRDLRFRWDWDDDGVFDTPYRQEARVGHVFPLAGVKWVTLEVVDGRQQIGRARQSVLVRKRCPAGMVSVAMGPDRSFCMDQYEWPNIAGERPQGGASFIEAFVSCRDQGKRLCTPQEWAWSCSGVDGLAYPYGEAYRRSACNSEGKETFRSGDEEGCISPFGIADMSGNLWEWVDDGGLPHRTIAGGDFSSGPLAGCRQVFPGAIMQSDDRIGFRCCK